MYEDDVFEEGYYYSVDLYFTPNENYSLSEDMTATVNGKPHDDTYGAVYEEYELAYVSAVFGSLEPQYTLTVPFTTTVKLGGSTAPGKTTFELAVVGANADEEAYKNVTVSASVTTNGAGSYEGTMTFKGTFQQLQNMLGAGAFVQQVNAGEPNWTYDDTVWGLLLLPDAVELATDYDDNDDTAPEYTVLVLPAVRNGEGGYYIDLGAIDWKNPQSEDMRFTNTYTYSAPVRDNVPVRDTATIIIGGEKEESKPAEENPNTGAPVAANMSTLSVLVLASAVAVLKTKKH